MSFCVWWRRSSWAVGGCWRRSRGCVLVGGKREGVRGIEGMNAEG